MGYSNEKPKKFIVLNKLEFIKVSWLYYLIFTCGFELNIYIYDYYDDTCIYKLKGHNSSVNTISLNEYEKELISLDYE